MSDSEIISAVAEVCGVAPNRIRSRTRLAPVVAARHIVWAILHRQLGSFSAVSRSFGVKHNTVMHGVFRVEVAKIYDPPLAELARKSKAAAGCP